MSDTTKNQGGGAAGQSLTQFFLSPNAAFDGGDVLLGSRIVPALVPGGTSTAPTTLVIPASTAAGSYYILARADGDGAILETNEANNTTARAVVAVGADLVVATLTVPAAAGVGATITVSDTTTNQGAGGAGATVTRFFLSKNTVKDASDVLLGARAVPSLGVDGASSSSSALPIPADTVPGSYYILARADDDGVVPETNEANNTRTALVLVGPDLVVATLTAPASGASGRLDRRERHRRNQGASGSAASRTAFYLSTNSAFDAADVLLGWRDLPDLGNGASNAGSTTLTIPASTVADTYYIIARADDVGSIPESNESNNTRVASIAIGPDTWSHSSPYRRLRPQARRSRWATPRRIRAVRPRAPRRRASTSRPTASSTTPTSCSALGRCRLLDRAPRTRR